MDVQEGLVRGVDAVQIVTEAWSGELLNGMLHLVLQ